jgi:hypothetical protein
MSEPIEIKSDKRFKPGNIKQAGNELRGNPETMDMHRMAVPTGTPMEMQLNPPIIVSSELGDALKKSARQAS